jgi:hypothetical protein
MVPNFDFNPDPDLAPASGSQSMRIRILNLAYGGTLFTKVGCPELFPIPIGAGFSLSARRVVLWIRKYFIQIRIRNSEFRIRIREASKLRLHRIRIHNTSTFHSIGYIRMSAQDF